MSQEHANGLFYYPIEELQKFKQETFEYEIISDAELVTIKYKGDNDTFLMYNNTIYYARPCANGMMEALVNRIDEFDSFELYNIKTATTSGRIIMDE